MGDNAVNLINELQVLGYIYSPNEITNYIYAYLFSWACLLEIHI